MDKKKVIVISLISVLVITFSIINYNLRYEMPEIFTIELYDSFLCVMTWRHKMALLWQFLHFL